MRRLLIRMLQRLLNCPARVLLFPWGSPDFVGTDQGVTGVSSGVYAHQIIQRSAVAGGTAEG
jgi:hypothetical protein